MSTFVVGDVHGCFQTFQALLRLVDFNSSVDRILFVGDLVNKGPDSLGMLRWAFENQDVADTVLGNHDLHLLRCAHGKREVKPGGGLDAVLDAPDSAELLDWLSRRPLMREVEGFVVVHAGILPAWGLKAARKFAAKAEKRLVKSPVKTLAVPDLGQSAEKNPDAAFLVNVFSVVRYCSSPRVPDFSFSGSPESAPETLKPWYSYREVQKIARTFIFGHWARHGFRIQDKAWCLDSSCVYGGQLSAVRLDDGQDFHVPCLDGSYPGDEG